MTLPNYVDSRPSTWAENISSPPAEILKILILQKRDEAIQELRNYQYTEARGVAAKIHRVKARITCLYLELYSSLKRSLSPEEFKTLSLNVRSESIERLTSAFFVMSDFLDEKKITRFDIKQNIDMTIPEEENLLHGL